MSGKYVAPSSKKAAGAATGAATAGAAGAAATTGAAAAATSAEASSAADVTKVKMCPGHTRPVCHINYSDIIDGTFWFVASCHDSNPMLRNGETGDWVGTFSGHKGAVFCSAFNAGATRVVTGSGDYSASIWDALNGQRLHTWSHKKYVKSCDWLGAKIATGCADGVVRIFDAGSLDAEPMELNHPVGTGVKAVYFIDANAMVTANDTVMMKWDLRAPASPFVTREIPGLGFLEYTHMHTLVAAHDKSITFVDTASLEIKSTFSTGDDVACASLSPDGKRVAAGSRLRAKEFTIDGTEVEAHRGHHGPVFHIRWAPDGNTFASGAEDSMVRIWPSHEIIEKYDNAAA